MQIHVFSEKYLDALAKMLPGARPCDVGRIKYLAVDSNMFVLQNLAGFAADIIGKPNAKAAIQADLHDFLAQNNHLHLDAYISICLEGFV